MNMERGAIRGTVQPHPDPDSSTASPGRDLPLLGPQDEADLIALLRQLTGISLAEGKAGFLSARLARRLPATGCRDYKTYRRRLIDDRAERTHFAEALVTHTTSFFRERPQFDWLIDEGYVQQSAERPKTPLTVWSAACSTGQEGYTALIAAEIAAQKHGKPIEVKLIGTDLSRVALQDASRAIYSRAQIEGIPETLRPDVLLSSRDSADRLRIVPRLRQRASWRQANLVTGEGLDALQADIVFLRNVLIYFDSEIREQVLDGVLRRLRLNGILCVGHTEAGHVRRPGLERIRPSIFRKLA